MLLLSVIKVLHSSEQFGRNITGRLQVPYHVRTLSHVKWHCDPAPRSLLHARGTLYRMVSMSMTGGTNLLNSHRVLAYCDACGCAASAANRMHAASMREVTRTQRSRQPRCAAPALAHSCSHSFRCASTRGRCVHFCSSCLPCSCPASVWEGWCRSRGSRAWHPSEGAAPSPPRG